MPYNKRKQKCTQSDGDKGNYVLSYTDKKGKKHRACHTSKKNMQGQIAAIEAEADTSESDMLEEIRALVREEVMRLGGSSAEVGPIKQDMDLMSVAKDMLEAGDSEGLEDLVDLNNAIYTSIDKRDAWESIGEQLLTAWGFDVPAQGKKAAAASEGGSDGSVATFWDVRKEGVLYSVKTSFKTPTKPTNYKQATQSSNIKLSALFSAIKENPPGTKLGNIGCIYSEEENSRVIGWGNVTAPISSDDLSQKIRSIIQKNVAPENVEIILSSYDSLVGTATGKKMSKDETVTTKLIIRALSSAGLSTSDGRLTGKAEQFLGSYSEGTPIASLAVYEPSYFFKETMGKLGDVDDNQLSLFDLPKADKEFASDGERNDVVKRLGTLARGMSTTQLDKLLSAAREIMNESLIREYISEATLINEELTGSDKSEIKRMIKKEIEGATNRKEIDKAFKKAFDSELKKSLSSKSVVDEIQKEVEKSMGSSANREVVVRICKDVLVKLYRELSFSYKPVIDRMKV